MGLVGWFGFTACVLYGLSAMDYMRPYYQMDVTRELQDGLAEGKNVSLSHVDLWHMMEQSVLGKEFSFGEGSIRDQIEIYSKLKSPLFLHTFFGGLSVIIMAIQVKAKKGTWQHKMLGYVGFTTTALNLAGSFLFLSQSETDDIFGGAANQELAFKVVLWGLWVGTFLCFAAAVGWMLYHIYVKRDQTHVIRHMIMSAACFALLLTAPGLRLFWSIGHLVTGQNKAQVNAAAVFPTLATSLAGALHYVCRRREWKLLASRASNHPFSVLSLLLIAPASIGSFVFAAHEHNKSANSLSQWTSMEFLVLYSAYGLALTLLYIWSWSSNRKTVYNLLFTTVLLLLVPSSLTLFLGDYKYMVGPEFNNVPWAVRISFGVLGLYCFLSATYYRWIRPDTSRECVSLSFGLFSFVLHGVTASGILLYDQLPELKSQVDAANIGCVVAVSLSYVGTVPLLLSLNRFVVPMSKKVKMQ